MKMVPYLVIDSWIPFQHGAQKRAMSAIVSELSKRFDRVYVADHDGIFKNKPQLNLVQHICDEMPTMYEGGVRYSTNVIDMLITGAEKAVIGTGTLVDLSELGGAFKLSENITFKVDFRDGIVSSDPAISGRAISDLFRDVSEIGIDDMVVPRALAEEASSAKSRHGFTLGVIAPASEQASLEALGIDYIVSEDYRSLVQDE
ncbi:MAG: HisA/HisF-related TIM barrel protein [Thermoplasmata archaeon]|nr:HisA/HisF-related TIM barrel protein [Thermoplasmata archaeon]